VCSWQTEQDEKKLKTIPQLRTELRQIIQEHENLIRGIEELMRLGAPVMDFEELRTGLFELKEWERWLEELPSCCPDRL
jgi:hypothetical protein